MSAAAKQFKRCWCCFRLFLAMLMPVMGKVADAQEAAPSCSESFSLLPKLPLDWQNLFFPLFNLLPICFFSNTHWMSDNQNTPHQLQDERSYISIWLMLAGVMWRHKSPGGHWELFGTLVVEGRFEWTEMWCVCVSEKVHQALVLIVGPHKWSHLHRQVQWEIWT